VNIQAEPLPGADRYTTEQEALDRAAEIGCEGTHTMDDDGQVVYMPCATHQEYDDAVNETEAEHTPEHRRRRRRPGGGAPGGSYSAAPELVVRFSSDITAADPERRTLVGTVVPFGASATPASALSRSPPGRSTRPKASSSYSSTTWPAPSDARQAS